MIALALVACLGTCPEGLVREGGRCVPTGRAGTAGPLDASTFLDRYEDDLCDALEECWCDAFDVETCDPQLDCPRASFPTGCAFDAERAEACLSGRWDCDVDLDEPTVTPPPECALVYDCGGSGTASTGSGS